ncbi:MAG: GtrA family protein [Prevotella sp.]|nr:GtrA family protein [Bacteroides sp.]MCM1445941.1 GtrA family protein [Prevotella sp.]
MSDAEINTKNNRGIAALFAGDTNNIVIQFFRYGIVGGAAFVADFGTLWFLTELAGMHYLLSATAGFIVGLVLNYLISVRWVFTASAAQRAASPRLRHFEFLCYALIGVIGLGLNSLILWLATDIVGIYYLASKLISAALVFIWNFLARRVLMSRLTAPISSL